MLLSVLMGGLAGCGDSADSYSIKGDDSKIIVFEYTNGLFEDWFIHDVGYGGRLARDPDTGCLFLDGADQQPQYVRLIWPRDTRPVNEDGEAGVLVPADRVMVRDPQLGDQPGTGRTPASDTYVIRVGDELLLGGTRFSSGPYTPEEHFGWVEEAVEASGCGTRGELLIIREPFPTCWCSSGA